MELSYAMCNGLRPSTERDLEIFHQVRASARPLSTIWKDKDDSAKVIEWDEDWERYLDHRAALIDEDGREQYLPWNIYKALKLDWLDGYGYAQRVGDCGSFGHKNSLKASNLTNAFRTKRPPREIALSIMYGLARGDGLMRFGDGCNLGPLAKYASQVGNYWTEDFGRYDAGGYCRMYQPGSDQDTHAKQTQSVIVFLPEATFDYCYLATSAGFGVNMGSSYYPTSSSLNKDELGVVDGYGRGGHCMAFVASHCAPSGQRYLYLENSHPTKYVNDKLNPTEHQWGVWVDEKQFKKLSSDGFVYGNWYVNIGELG